MALYAAVPKVIGSTNVPCRLGNGSCDGSCGGSCGTGRNSASPVNVILNMGSNNRAHYSAPYNARYSAPYFFRQESPVMQPFVPPVFENAYVAPQVVPPVLVENKSTTNQTVTEQMVEIQTATGRQAIPLSLYQSLVTAGVLPKGTPAMAMPAVPVSNIVDDRVETDYVPPKKKVYNVVQQALPPVQKEPCKEVFYPSFI